MMTHELRSLTDRTQDVIDIAVARYPKLVMTSAFGLSGVVLIHLTNEHRIPILFVDTGYMFPETLALRDWYAQDRLIFTYGPARWDGAAEPNIEDPGSIERCCHLRKVLPMQRAIRRLAPHAVMTARGRFQAVTRAALEVFEHHLDPVRVNPLAFWRQEQISAYIAAHGLRYNPLYEQGYPSIGCQPCTRPVENGEDIRAGRWDGLGKVECGLWQT